MCGQGEQDRKKLERPLQYIWGSNHFELTIEADNSHVVKWWVDATFAVSCDMKGHSGGVMSLGKGTLYSSSTRQKINIRSSTGTELVGANDFLLKIHWTCYFLKAQCYTVKENTLHQDNQSAFLPEKNGKVSSGRCTRHINIDYFFITDRIAASELNLKHYPATEM